MGYFLMFATSEETIVFGLNNVLRMVILEATLPCRQQVTTSSKLLMACGQYTCALRLDDSDVLALAVCRMYSHSATAAL